MSAICDLSLAPILALDFSGFAELAFPEDADIVYVLCFKRKDSSDCIPFYVGESSRHLGRFGDYVSAKFAASTDFKVGEAVKQLRVHGEVIFRYKGTNDRRAEEKSWIDSIEKSGFQLLNRLPGYNYATADKSSEKRKVEEFIIRILLNENKA